MRGHLASAKRDVLAPNAVLCARPLDDHLQKAAFRLIKPEPRETQINLPCHYSPFLGNQGGWRL